MDTAFAVQLLQFIGGLAALIVVHELGHFIAARLCRVEVEEFGIGFPPRITRLFKFSGTEFTLNWIPLGGFVRPKGENDPAVEGGLAAASPWVRLVVLFAGPAMNLLVGVALGVMFFYSMGDWVTSKVLIQQVADGSPAYDAGIQAGDQIMEVNGQVVDSTEKLKALIAANANKQITLVYLRGDERVSVLLVPRDPPPPNQGAIGVVLTHPRAPISLDLAFRRSVEGTAENIRGILLLPFRLLSGQASPEESRIVGYKGMFDIYQEVRSPLWFFMVISISLGVINLFPIPALDGGRILLILPEIMFRRRIPPRYENAIHLVGFTLLILLLIYVNLQDFINPIQIP